MQRPWEQPIVRVYVRLYPEREPFLYDAYDCGPGRIFIGNTVYVTGGYEGEYEGVPVFVPEQHNAYSYDVAGGGRNLQPSGRCADPGGWRFKPAGFTGGTSAVDARWFHCLRGAHLDWSAAKP